MKVHLIAVSGTIARLHLSTLSLSALQVLTQLTGRVFVFVSAQRAVQGACYDSRTLSYSTVQSSAMGNGRNLTMRRLYYKLERHRGWLVFSKLKQSRKIARYISSQDSS